MTDKKRNRITDNPQNVKQDSDVRGGEISLHPPNEPEWAGKSQGVDIGQMTPAVDRRPAPRSGPGVMSVSDDNGHLTEIDQRILELNQEGHSTRQISRLLNERYDIKLGRSSVCTSFRGVKARLRQ